MGRYRLILVSSVDPEQLSAVTADAIDLTFMAGSLGTIAVEEGYERRS